MRIGVLASGAGSNLQALLDTFNRGNLRVDVPEQGTAVVALGPTPHRAAPRVDAPEQGTAVVAVASDRTDAPALSRAGDAGVPGAAFPAAGFPGREARDLAIAQWLGEAEVELVVLAGYMQLLSAAFLARFPNRVINVHPALLPAFPGLDAIGQALDYGVRLTGVTVHFVDEGVDTGQVILQEAVPIHEGDDRESLSARIHAVEHRLLPEAVRLIAAGRVRPAVGTGRTVQIG